MATREATTKRTGDEIPQIPGQADLYRSTRGVGVNSVTLVGRLAADPELRHSDTGMAKASMRLVTNDRTDPEFHNVVAFSTLAERTTEYLRKGRLVYVNGRLHTYEFESRTGKHRRTEVIADNIQFLDKAEAA